jgi:hypothetical protein
MEKYVPKLNARMMEVDVMETISLNYVIPQKYVNPIFTCTFPVNISKRIFDLFIWEKSGERCLLRLIFKCL